MMPCHAAQGHTMINLEQPTHITKVWTKPVTQNCIMQLRMQGVTVERKNGHYIGAVDGHEVFRAMNGARGYLVRYAADLFTAN